MDKINWALQNLTKIHIPKLFSPFPVQVFFELDLTSPRTLSQLSQCQLLPPGQHISEVIPTDLYMKLRMHLDYVRKAMPGWLTK